MATFRTGVVTRVVSRRAGLVRVEVDGEPAHALTDIVGSVEAGDAVVVNTTAVDAGLGTGGSHIVHWNLSGEHRGTLGVGRSMRLRYTSEQIEVDTWEEAATSSGAVAGPGALPDLTGTRVALCHLHSHVCAVALAAHHADPSSPIAVVMTDDAALALATSDLLATLRGRNVVTSTVSTGQSFGGDVEAVTVPSGVDAARHAGCSRVVVGPGPGHLGTGSALGFGSLNIVGNAEVLSALGATVGVIARVSAADQRDRHGGVSHHSLTVTRLIGRAVDVPTPRGEDAAWIPSPHAVALVDPIDLAEACAAHDIELTTMGRRLVEDPQTCAWLGAGASWLSDPVDHPVGDD